METIRLLLVDDHDIVRTGLNAFLSKQAGLQVVAEANNGAQAIEQALEARPDVVIMDISMPDMDGLEATRRLKAVYPEGQVLALTVHQDKQYFFKMLAEGASGYVTKQSAADDLVTAIHAIAAGHVYLQPPLARWLLDDYQRLSSNQKSQASELAAADSHGLEVLTRRERQVLEAVAEGMTSPEIGKLLGISHKTVARHRERIMNKLDLHSCSELVKFAIRTGLIDL